MITFFYQWFYKIPITRSQEKPKSTSIKLAIENVFKFIKLTALFGTVITCYTINWKWSLIFIAVPSFSFVWVVETRLLKIFFEPERGKTTGRNWASLLSVTTQFEQLESRNCYITHFGFSVKYSSKSGKGTRVGKPVILKEA